MRTANVDRIEVPLLVLIHADFLAMQKNNAAVPLWDFRRLLGRDLKELLCQPLDGLSALRGDARQGFRVETLRREHIGIGILFATDQVPQQYGGDHGSRHAPFLKACGDVPVRAAFRVVPDVGHTVRGHAVLRRPAGDLPAVREPFLCRMTQKLVFPSRAVLPAAVPAAAQQEQIAIIAEGE